MSLADFKINVGDDGTVNGMGLVKEPDKLTGDAQKNKMIFDKLVREVVSVCINRSIDLLMSEAGAGEIGAKDPIGEETKTVQEVLSALKDYVDELKAEKIAALMLDGETKSTVQGVINEIAQKLEQQIGTEQLENKAVTTDKIAEGSVTLEKLAEKVIEKMNEAEAFAKGTADGISVPERKEDNARYYKECSEESASSAAESASAALQNQGNSSKIYVQVQALKVAAESAKTDAENAAASASDYAKNASDFSESAAASAASVSQSTQLIDNLNVHRYDALATETQGGADIIHTDIGADNIPVKSFAVTVTSGTVPAELTVKQMGKNLFDVQNVTLLYGKWFNPDTGELATRTIACCSEQYFAVRPNKEYTLSGVAVLGTGYASRAYFYDADKSYIGYKSSPYDASLTFTTPENCCWVRFSLPQYVHSGYTGSTATDPAEGAVGKIRLTFKTQLEFGAESSYEAYTETLHSIAVASLDTPTAPETLPSTALGQNTFMIERADGITAAMDVTYRVDPTLAFDKLQAAIVAAGAT
ncbi:MAG: hypothetical protein IKC50_02945 [Oscillospiraceae bacterium]|nr:hypothetical protein [Oscillospiraceae bacterium]MBR2977215.1 hypothetical protein [Oscillospiraceae bacterium]